MSAFEQALPAENFLRSQIPPERSGKRVHRFMSMKELLPIDHDHQQDVSSYTTALATLRGTISSAYVPAPLQPEFSGYSSSFSVSLS